MHIHLDRNSSLALYTQISDYLQRLIASGDLAPGSRLPSSRELATSTGVSRITVENAYSELEARGLVDRRMGSGTYVLEPPPVSTGMSTAWERRVSNSPFSARRRLDVDEEAMQDQNLISLAEGGGDSRLYPVDDFRRSMVQATREHPEAAFGYGDSRGLLGLRESLAQLLANQGLPVSPDHILITAGSQQALALTLQVLLAPGDEVAVDAYTYARALELMSSLKLHIVPIPMDEDGMNMEALEHELLRGRVRLVYTMPNFQNPTGTCLSSHRRRKLVELAAQYGVTVFEDDYVGELRYDGFAQPSLRSLDVTGNVIYTSTFSKMLLPGLRVGFLVADEPLLTALHRCKLSQDLATSNLMQHALQNYLSVGRYRRHLRAACRTYRHRRDAMCNALDSECADHLQFGRPAGGLFLWARLPTGMPARQLAERARRKGLYLSVGDSFSVDPSASSHFLRLNFAALTETEIGEAARRLARVLR